MHTWLETGTNMDRSHVDLLRHIRVFKNSDEVVVSRPGRIDNMGLGKGGEGVGDDWTAITGGDQEAEGEAETEAEGSEMVVEQ
jgi:translation machinery-associated protein 16